MKYTSEVFSRLSKGQFLSANSIDSLMRAIYNDVEDCFGEYADFFLKIDFILEAGDGYFYFSRRENKVVTEQKLKTFFAWIDCLDFLKTYDNGFGQGTQFSLAQIEVRLASDIELKEKLMSLDIDKTSHREKLETIANMLTSQGFAETINEIDGMYQITSAFRYLEEIIQTINITEEVQNEISE